MPRRLLPAVCLSWALLLLPSCEVADVLDTAHVGAVAVAPAALVYMINPAAGVICLVAATTAEVLVPNGEPERIREARREARLGQAEDRANSAARAVERVAATSDWLKAGLLALGIFAVGHYFLGSRVSRALRESK